MNDKNNFDFSGLLDSFTENAGKIAEIKSVFDNNDTNTTQQQQYEQLQQKQVEKNWVNSLDSKYLVYGGIGSLALILLFKK